MQKDFDKWNELKKSVDKSKVIVFANKREIWWCNLGLNIGVETNGKNDIFERPILVLKIHNSESMLVAPLTSDIKTDNFHHILTSSHVPGSVKLTQIKTISHKRLSRKIDRISKVEFEIIKDKVRQYI